MDCFGDKVLSTEYAHIDGKENRCLHFTTLVLSVYHPILRKQIPLAIMECEGESTIAVKKFWQLVDKALSEKFNKPEKFNPCGLISDEAGAFWKAASETFHPDIVANSISCEFQFKENVNRHSRALGNKIFSYLSFILKGKMYRES